VTDKQVPSVEMLADAKAKRRDIMPDAVFDYFKATDGELIRYARFPASEILDIKGTVIFMPGRTEFIEKFIEDVRVFNALGYACAAMDLRGQGMSFRPHPNRNKHYVETFDQHIVDVKTMFEKVLENKMPKPYYLMGHSAGSHVILRTLHAHPDLVEKAVVVAPMVRIYTGGVPAFLAKGLAAFSNMIGKGRSYIPGHTAIKDGRWGWRKLLTSDDDRFGDEDHFIKTKDKRLAVGGATYRWLLEAIKSTEKLNAAGVPESIKTPVLLLQAGDDVIVDNKAQSALVARMPDAKLVRIEGAMHEILKEKDAYRAQVWAAISGFMDLSEVAEDGD